jgi:hypothetical protein
MLTTSWSPCSASESRVIRIDRTSQLPLTSRWRRRDGPQVGAAILLCGDAGEFLTAHLGFWGRSGAAMGGSSGGQSPPTVAACLS